MSYSLKLRTGFYNYRGYIGQYHRDYCGGEGGGGARILDYSSYDSDVASLFHEE